MSLHSSASKVGTTEYLSQGYGHPVFPEGKTTTIIQSTTEPRVREVKTVTTEVHRNEGVSAGEIPHTTYYNPQIIDAQSTLLKNQASPYQVYNEPVPIVELKEYGHGNIVFRPMEARFFRNDGYGDMINPYCKVKIGHHSQKGSLSKSGGADVIWNDVIKLDRKKKSKFAKIKCKDKNRVNLHGLLGYCMVDLNELAEKGRICGWFPLWQSVNHDRITGELLLDVQDLSSNVAPTVV